MDYIAPSSACIKPTLISSGGIHAVGPADPTASASGVVGMKRGGNAPPLGPGIAAAAQHADVVKITLQDCLACSGCVTTAETVLVNAQSRHEIVSALLTSPASTSSSTTGTGSVSRPRLVSISSQSCASLAAHLHMSMAAVYELVAGFMRATLTTAGLQEAARNAEIAAAESPRDAMKNEEVSGASTTATTDAAAAVLSESEPPIYVVDLEWAEQLSAELTAQEYDRRRRGGGTAEVGPLPLIVSSCPGWVCYCEKQGSALLPHLCPVMSAQGIAGSYAKRAVAANLYHVSIQPCFDRKLEAARDSMTSSTTAPPADGADMPVFYTDCVLSTAELLEWMKEADPTLPWRGRLDTNVTAAAVALVGGNCPGHTAQQPTQLNEEEAPTSTSSPAASAIFAPAHDAARFAGSGGYHRSVIAHRLRVEGAAALPSSSSPSPDTPASIAYEVKRNRNHQLATCAALPEEVFCIGYGFQQIQNVVRGLKKRIPAMRGYTFIELMACPDGCLNGGGQVRPAQQPHAEVLNAVLDAYARSMEGSREKGGLGAATAAASSGSALACTFASAQPVSSDAQAEDGEVAMKAQRRRVEAAWKPFADATIAVTAPSLGDALWRCTFRDREKEFAAMLNDGNVHSLKW
ncbi:putative hydrogenase [Leishmania infantum JPCM5]|uniref:Hydrogenase_-_putative n=4 Tax=Leishmania donovani species complex TaxID=38574 RepID=A0A6L0WIJ3_LEIIN|nr:putative hydrogenase [Leishmania infantum JPCM5]XP_003858210.1 hydrogenase, putative [Leishmania donovani]CAC9442944.1 hydrogenase_-_putative [Leishmania infantum]AYU75928.1 hydrogenase, putative [Leishmania donovani]CAM65342.1 putative hydrogenase [Leishmania infantum JPCM5]CBZ31486.1 hydrogenase, putative [Leishmania donovani]SUZ38943.1 hydrogenase_-_putative [Leishmania infantum]|eukprot:XP_001462996.1 putative hydrogenase [Leishmania infantum JPCM5]